MTRATYQRDRGATSRQQRSRQRARKKSTALREQGLVKADVGNSPAKYVAKDNWNHYDAEDLWAFGIHDEPDSGWELTAMAAARWNSTFDDKCEYKAITTDDPRDGFTICTADTKSELMNKIGADSTTKVGQGQYLVEVGEATRMRSTKLDKDEYHNGAPERGHSVSR